jgi:DNA-binding NarL/FixJ family response regulator
MNVLLIDDHALFREGVALLLRPLVDDLSTWEAGSCEEALALIDERGVPDMVLMDLGLPGMSGLECITVLHERLPGLPVVALSSSDDRDTVLAALDGGAMGFIPKSSTSSVFVAALKLILANGIYLPPAVFLSGPRTADEGGTAPAPPARTPSELGLTARQADVLHLILQGKPAKLICRELDLSPGTVKAHTSAVLRALNVTTRTQAVVVAGKLGLRFGRRPSA